VIILENQWHLLDWHFLMLFKKIILVFSSDFNFSNTDLKFLFRFLEEFFGFGRISPEVMRISNKMRNFATILLKLYQLYFLI